MTKEEAKRFGQCLLKVADFNADKDTIEFTKIALEALDQEPCEDAISRQAVLTYIEFILTHGLGKKKSFEFIKKYVERQPSITPKQKMGRWIKVDDEEPIAYDCSECVAMVSRRYRFCPSCGAKMRESGVGNDGNDT